MDHKMVTASQKRANKPHTRNKTKKKAGPLKVVYITNPIKFNATASEFRSLVQELTGKDSDVPEPDRFPTGDAAIRGGAGGGWEAAKDHEHQVHALDEGRKVGHPSCSCDGEGAEYGSDPLMIFGSYDDNDDSGISTPHMRDGYGFEGLMASSFWNEGAYDLDVGLKRQS